MTGIPLHELEIRSILPFKERSTLVDEESSAFFPLRCIDFRNLIEQWRGSPCVLPPFLRGITAGLKTPDVAVRVSAENRRSVLTMPLLQLAECLEFPISVLEGSPSHSEPLVGSAVTRLLLQMLFNHFQMQKVRKRLNPSGYAGFSDFSCFWRRGTAVSNSGDY